MLSPEANELCLDTPVFEHPAIVTQPEMVVVSEEKAPVWRKKVAAAVLTVCAATGISTLAETPADAAAIVSTTDGDPSAYKTMTMSQKLQAAESAAHRGVWNGSITQNSVRSFINGARKHVNYDEGDIRFTKDHVGILMHSSNIGSVTRGGQKCNLNVATHTYNQISKCRLNDGQRIPTVAKIASVMSPYRNRTGLMLELKDKYTTEEELDSVKNILTSYGYTGDNLVLESKFPRNLSAMKDRMPDVETLYIKSSNTNPPQAGQLNSDVINGVVISYKGMENALNANPNYVNAFRDKGMDVYPWFNNATRSQIARVIGQNATGFIANNPQLINKMR
jgi:glycerophosphoryl diester phosphodiesterase